MARALGSARSVPALDCVRWAFHSAVVGGHRADVVACVGGGTLDRILNRTRTRRGARVVQTLEHPRSAHLIIRVALLLLLHAAVVGAAEGAAVRALALRDGLAACSVLAFDRARGTYFSTLGGDVNAVACGTTGRPLTRAWALEHVGGARIVPAHDGVRGTRDTLRDDCHAGPRRAAQTPLGRALAVQVRDSARAVEALDL